jgi:hypothetical protein
MPIVVDGESIAVVYADDSGQTPAERPAADPDLSARFAEALRHHTVALLMRLRTELKAMAELRAYAGALVDELEQMYRADEAAGKPEEELRKRLLANLDYARSIYANRATFESPAAAELFEAQIGAMIDAHRDAAFGRDLELVTGSGGAARAAEAS